MNPQDFRIIHYMNDKNQHMPILRLIRDILVDVPEDAFDAFINWLRQMNHYDSVVYLYYIHINRISFIDILDAFHLSAGLPAYHFRNDDENIIQYNIHYILHSMYNIMNAYLSLDEMIIRINNNPTCPFNIFIVNNEYHLRISSNNFFHDNTNEIDDEIPYINIGLGKTVLFEVLNYYMFYACNQIF